MVDQYDKICYKKNFVNKVLFKFDFATGVADFKRSMPKIIYDVIKKYYPVAEPLDVISAELQINLANTSTSQSIEKMLMKQWNFWSRNRKNKCIVDYSSVAFLCYEYDVFETLYQGIIDVMTSILEKHNDIQGKRIGLRYVNDIPMSKEDKWIDDRFLNTFQAHRSTQTTRLMTNVEYTLIETDISVNLKYGYYNPDYPSILKRNNFVIDVDAYSTGIIYKEDLANLLTSMHHENQKCFEEIITDDFRNELNKNE